jgi:Zn-dependent membrane protease YugP
MSLAFVPIAASPVWLICGILVVLLSLWAQMRVKSTFMRFDKVGSRRGFSGAEVARMLLDARGLHDVRVEHVAGMLTDHYDPTSRTLRLSDATYRSRSVAAIGVAAHEAGHALQHADAYPWLGFRSAVVPLVGLGSRLLPFLMLITIFSLSGGGPGLIAYVMVGALGAIALFSVITLPVEFDASRRALETVGGAGILQGEELAAAKEVLGAAALTYVAAAVNAVFDLLHWAMILFGGRRGDDE